MQSRGHNLYRPHCPCLRIWPPPISGGPLTERAHLSLQNLPRGRLRDCRNDAVRSVYQTYFTSGWAPFRLDETSRLATFCTTKSHFTELKSNPDGMSPQRQGAKIGRYALAATPASGTPARPRAFPNRHGLVFHVEDQAPTLERTCVRRFDYCLPAVAVVSNAGCGWRESSMRKIRDQRPGNRRTAFRLLPVPTPTVSTV